MNTVRKWYGFSLVILMMVPFMLHAAEVSNVVTAQPSRSVSIALYDAGLAVVGERRVFPLRQGRNQVLLNDMPEKMDYSSLIIQPARGSQTGLTISQMNYEPAVSDASRALNDGRGRPIIVQTDKGKVEGTLVAATAGSGQDDFSLIVDSGRGMMTMLPAYKDLTAVVLPDAASYLRAESSVLLDVESEDSDLKDVRLQYITRGMQWRSYYEVVMSSSATEARLRGRAEIVNTSGADFERANIRLIATDRGADLYKEDDPTDADAGKDAFISGAYSYQFGQDRLRKHTGLAALAPVFEYGLKDAMVLRDGDTRYVDFCSSDHVSTARRYVYDGVVFDRFERNRRNDWNYGTKFQPDVNIYLEFELNAAAGLDLDLAPGWLHLYQQTEQDETELIASALFPGARKGSKATMLVGRARGLTGERERTWYAEVVPLHEYDESFEIRLQNDTAQDVEVTVVEHMMRWSVFDIVKADAEYETTSADTIAFPVLLPANGKKAIHYTVRYRW